MKFEDFEYMKIYEDLYTVIILNTFLGLVEALFWIIF